MKKTLALLIIQLLLSVSTMASEAKSSDPMILERITNMRTRQEAEENNVYRVIQQPITVRQDVCTPVEQARQRIRDLNGPDGEKIGTINVEAGHGEVTIDHNSGEINNSVNVQAVAPNDRKCF